MRLQKIGGHTSAVRPGGHFGTMQHLGQHLGRRIEEGGKHRLAMRRFMHRIARKAFASIPLRLAMQANLDILRHHHKSVLASTCYPCYHRS
mmetsp:Transcript_74230/g.138652  ORF Transcript_74230/g.138652 Transcript_74230/m.138652 type:complete len:91 (-) Transcript_74230:13-285(-)